MNFFISSAAHQPACAFLDLAPAGRSFEIFRPDNEIQDRDFFYRVSKILTSAQPTSAFLFTRVLSLNRRVLSLPFLRHTNLCRR